jgi:hypothetical protein
VGAFSISEAHDYRKVDVHLLMKRIQSKKQNGAEFRSSDDLTTMHLCIPLGVNAEHYGFMLLI